MARTLSCLLLVLAALTVAAGCTRKEPDKAAPVAERGDPHVPPPRRARAPLTPLMQAVAAGDPVAVEALLAKGADPEARARDGVTALIVAARHGRGAIAERLLAAGAQVDAATDAGRTALMEAAERGDLVLVRLLLKHGAQVNRRTRIRHLQTSALHLACASGYEDVVVTLLEAGADVNIQDEAGQTPLMDAAYGNPRLVRLLLRYGADPSITNLDGKSATRIAREEGQPEIYRLLKQARGRQHKKAQAGGN